MGAGWTLGRRSGGASLQPRRLELDQRHHQAAQQGCGDGRPGAGADPERARGAALIHGRLPDRAPVQGGPAVRQLRVGRRHRRGRPKQARYQDPGQAARGRCEGARDRRQAGPRQLADPSLRGVHRHRAQDLAGQRVRPTPGCFGSTRRVRPAAAGPVPGRRLRGVGGAVGDQPDPQGRCLMRQLTRQSSRRPGGQLERQLKRRGREVGRDMSRLLADFGHDLPSVPPAPVGVKEPRLFRYASRRGAARQGRGWAAASAPVSAWRMTSDQAPVFWPFIGTPGLPPTGAQMGIDQLSGGSFYADPLGWVLRDDVPVTNPNVFSFGKPGLGKSATTKAFCNRMMEFGYRVLILGDPKDEYEKLCRAYGVEPFVIGHGMSTRINPLAMGPMGQGWDQLEAGEAQRRVTIIFARWLTLVRGLVGSMRIGVDHVPFGPTEADVVQTALEYLTGYTQGSSELRETTIPELWDLLHNPTEELITRCEYASQRQFLDETRLLRNALGQLVKGTLAGLFDAHTSIDVDWRAPIQSLSLSRLEPLGDEAVGIALTCLNSWGQAMREIADPGDMRIVVRDETWKQMRLGVEAVKSLDANLRLSRRDADVQVLLAHKPSDMLTAGDAHSQAVAIARDLLHLCDTKVLHGQDQAVGDELGALLGLTPIAQRLVTGWAVAGKGRALWLVGDRAFKVQTVLTAPELRLTYTNEALTAGGPA